MMVSDIPTSLIIVGVMGILFAVGSAVWEVITETIGELEDSPGTNPISVSYTCEHCGHTIVHWNQDPMVTDILTCPRCGGVLQDQQAAASIAHEYFEEEEEGGW
jgi:DNA-directed RNA polymerase subunit RPC12/RpoP